MTAKFFGQFLLEKHVITREMLLDAVKYQKSINTPLCALAVEHGYLTKDQMETLDASNTGSDRKFIQAAVQNNMLTFQQLEGLSRLRSDRWLFLGEALVEKGYLNLVQLNQLLAEYRDVLSLGEEAAPEPRQDWPDIPEQEVVSSLMNITVDLFVHYTKQIVQVTSVEKLEAEPADIAYIFTQEVTGDKNFLYGLALPEELTLSIATYIVGEPQTEVSELVLDAVSEFVNVVIGNGCTALSMKDFKVTAKPPAIVTKEMAASLLKDEAVAVNLKTTKGDFRLLFFFKAAENAVQAE